MLENMYRRTAMQAMHCSVVPCSKSCSPGKSESQREVCTLITRAYSEKQVHA